MRYGIVMAADILTESLLYPKFSKQVDERPSACCSWTISEVFLWRKEAYGGGDWEDDHQLMRLPSLRLGGESHPPPPLFSHLLSLTLFHGDNCREFLLEVQKICQALLSVEPFLVRRLSSILALPFWCCLSPRSFASAYARCTANVPLSLLSCEHLRLYENADDIWLSCSIHLCYQSYPLTENDFRSWVGCFGYNINHVR